MADTVNVIAGAYTALIATKDLGAAGHAQRIVIVGAETPAGASMVDEEMDGLGVVMMKPLQALEEDGATILDSIVAIGPDAHGVPATLNPLRIGGFASASAPANVDASDAVNWWMDLAGRGHVLVDAPLPALVAGAALIGDVDLQPRATGGLTLHKLISAATTNATSVKASAGKVYALQVFNVNAEERYLKLYNKASAPTVGTDVPVRTLTIPGRTAGAGFVVDVWHGWAFPTGIAYALTTGAADTDTGAVAAGEIVVNLDYK